MSRNIARLSGRSGPLRLALPALLALAAAPALAAPAKDAAAEKALKEAMGDDYFETRFDDAEKKLRAAIEACGTGCSEGMKAKLHVALGTVLAGGKKELDDAQDVFVTALKLDPTVKPDPDLTTAQVQFAFEKAKADLKLGPAPGADAPASAASHSPPAEQRVRTPVPLYLEILPTVLADVRKVTGSFAGPGNVNFTPLDFRKLGERGYGAEVACDEVAMEGDLTYFITILGENDKVLGTLGTRDAPLRVPIRAAITKEAPHWPGFTAPDQCSSKGSGPDQCLDDKQCNSGLVCKGGQCLAPQKTTSKLSNWITVTFGADFGLFAADNVCSEVGQNDDNYVCQREDGSRYLGTPTTGAANNVNFGFVPGTMRVAIQYERVLFDNFSAAGRIGFAFNGASGEGVNFLPLHLEARLAYSFGQSAFEKPGVRPFVFLSGGLAQVDSTVSRVQVLEDGQACGAQDPLDQGSPCTKPSPDGRTEPRLQYLSATKQAGNGFITAGVGLVYTPLRNVGLHVAVRGGVTFPVLIGVIAPEAGFTFGF